MNFEIVHDTFCWKWANQINSHCHVINNCYNVYNIYTALYNPPCFYLKLSNKQSFSRYNTTKVNNKIPQARNPGIIQVARARSNWAGSFFAGLRLAEFHASEPINAEFHAVGTKLALHGRCVALCFRNPLIWLPNQPPSVFRCSFVGDG